jgi:hypothetical protein
MLNRARGQIGSRASAPHPYAKSVEAIIKTGLELIAAKEALPHGAFQRMMRSDLPFKERTAQKFMAVARHPVLSNASNWSHLPPSWTSLYQLSRLDSEFLSDLIENGSAATRRKLVEMEIGEILVEHYMRKAMAAQPEPNVPAPAPREPEPRPKEPEPRPKLCVVSPSTEQADPVPPNVEDRANGDAAERIEREVETAQFEPVPDDEEIAFPEGARFMPEQPISTVQFRESEAPSLCSADTAATLDPTLARLKAAWNDATNEARAEFLSWAKAQHA